MLRVWIHRVRPGKEARLRAWFAELNARADEVRASFTGATIRAEQAFIVPGSDGPLLVYVSEAADQDRATTAYNASVLPIDVEHRRIMEECVLETLDAAPLYDVAGA